MARLLAGLAAAEKIQYKDQPGGLEAPGSGPRSSDKARRPKKRTSGRRPSAQANSVDSPRAGTSISAAQWASRSRDEDGITLDALGLSVQDTRAAADGEGVADEAEALTLEALGLSLSDTTAIAEPESGGLGLESVAERMSRILEVFGQGESAVRASADFVLISQPVEPSGDSTAAPSAITSPKHGQIGMEDTETQ